MSEYAKDDLYGDLLRQQCQNQVLQQSLGNALGQALQQRGIISPTAIAAAQSQWAQTICYPGQLIPYRGISLGSLGALAGMAQALRPLTAEDYIRYHVERYQELTDKKFLRARPSRMDSNLVKNRDYDYQAAAWQREWDRRFLVRPMGGER